MIEKVDLLLVDDEPRNLDALEAILNDPGYRLLRAEDANTALRLLVEHQVAAIMLDVKMPGTDGFELAQMIKATRRYRQIPILFLTAYRLEDDDVLTGYGKGAADYLTKPLNPSIVRQKVSVFAELFRKTQALAELNEKLEERVKERTAELERSEALLREADRKKDEFLGVLAHELRNPLTPICFGLDLLPRYSGDLSPRAKKMFDTMNRQLDHMVRLVDDLLDVSRITRGAVELRRERVDLVPMIQNAVEMARPALEARDHTLTVNAERGVFTVGDPTRIAQIIGNLLNNAAKFTNQGGRIAVELDTYGDQAIVRVVDSGEGIATEDLERVFGMFTRIRLPNVPVEPGLGIGLALGRHLAEMHGGTLTATSAGPGRGSTFTLTLPLDDAPEKRAPARAAPAASTQRLEIVLIEDNEDNAMAISEWLEDLGHHVSVARSGREGLDLVAQKQPRLVLCDIGMSEMDGLEVCRRVRAMTLARQPLMIAMTGWGRESDRQQTTQAGFDDHLVKPVGVDALTRVLQGLA
jgi:signal transduction histidine kinase